MHFKENKEEYKRKGIFLLLIIFTSILQNTGGLFPKVFSASAMPVIPLIVCIAMFEKEMTGMSLGLVAGILWDFASARMDGFYSVILTLTGFFCSYLIRRYMRNNIVTAVVYTVSASLGCSFAYWIFFVVMGGAEGAGMLLLNKYLLSVVYTVVFTPVYYYFVRMIYSNHIRTTEIEE